MAKKNSSNVSNDNKTKEKVEVVENVVTEEPPVSAEPVVSSTDSEDFSAKFEKLVQNMNSMMVTIKESQTSLKTLQKEYVKAIKTVNKKTKKVTNGVKRAPSGFAKPTHLSDEICDFLKIDKGSMLARTEVTRLINQYIKANNLQYAEDRRRIIPDDALQKIIQSKDSDVVTYFNLQSFIKHHFKEKVV